MLSPVNSLGDEVAKNLEMRVMPGNWNLGASIQALSKQGTTNVVTSGTVNNAKQQAGSDSGCPQTELYFRNYQNEQRRRRQLL